MKTILSRATVHQISLLASVLLGVTGVAEAQTQPNPEYVQAGKRSDTSRTYIEYLPPSSERTTPFGAGMPGSNMVKKGGVPASVATPRAPVAPTFADAAAATQPVSAKQDSTTQQSDAPKLVARIGDTVTGALFESGRSRLLPDARQHLDALVARLQGKRNIRLEVVGHTDTVGIAPRTKLIFPNNQKLSEARARMVARYLQEKLALPAAVINSAGRGESVPIADNATEAGRARNRRTEIAVWFDEQQPATSAGAAEAATVVANIVLMPAAAPLAAPAPAAASVLSVTPTVPATPAVPCGSRGPADLNDLPFRITVDGQPVTGDRLMPEADRQRCVDVALEKNEIQVRFDPLQVKPALNTWSYPDGVVRGSSMEFGAYANYLAWIKQGEVRVFAGKRPVGKPLAVLPVRWDGMTSWTPPLDAPEEMVFLLRVYDTQGRFDETAPKPLRLLDKARPHTDLESAQRERLVGWGQDSRTLATIPASGGTVTVNGKALKPGQTVYSLGSQVPVDAKGDFAIRQILPSGPQTVTVEVRNSDGSSAAFSRNLTIADQDWFYIAIADLTLGQNHASGPAELVTADSKHYDGKTYIDGRGAFYLKGKIKGEYLLTASADTSEQPIDDLFSNFSSKDPRYLLRRIDPNRYYPVYGDDSTLVEDAPTQGKFYVRLDKGDSHVLWGNFQTQWTGNELTQYSRALYGGNLMLKTPAITRYGERRAALSAFAAEPGTMQSRDEFRGTGGSLYYLRHLDITVGSERVWVEVRDKDSDMVLERKQLVPEQDYTLNALQGRLLLAKPLSSVSGSGSLISSGGVPGNPTYLVTSYEYTPGLTEVAGYTYGLNGFWWVSDFVRLGLTGYRQGDNEQAQKLGGMDITVRLTQESYVKAEVARSDGPGVGQQDSISGGFEFSTNAMVGEKATAKRVETQLNLADVREGLRGTVGAYWQDKEKGFSGPGELTPGEQVTQQGGRASIPIGRTVEAEVKIDDRDADSQSARSAEGALRWQLTPQWQVGLAARNDSRTTTTANASSILSENGNRTDVQGRLHYRPQLQVPDSTFLKPANWDLYGFVQGTTNRTGNRRDNDRLGVGGGWQALDRLRLSAEASGGDGGAGGTLSGEYRLNDRSNVYLGYTMETERPDSNIRGRYSTAVTGTKYRINDQMSLYGETKATHGAGPESLVNAFGLDLAPSDRWSYGLKGEWGTISDPVAGDLKRQAVGLSLGYKKDKIKYAGNLELRHEDGDAGHRTVWLMRNALSFQVDRTWRLFGKANFSVSDNSQGAFYDGDFVELVAGGAYRPVDNDRWNALFKYTYFQDTPTAGQLTSSDLVADYSQRSHVLNADAIYDLTPRLSLGGKVGYRYSRMKAGKVDGDWFDSHAVLGVLRADYHVIRRWDLVGEARTLWVSEAEDQRSGFLAAVYYHIDTHFKLGVGYNFTDFSDDLTDLSYRSHGWFLNVIGKF